MCCGFSGFFDVSRWGILFSIAHILSLLFCCYQINIDWNNLLTLHGLFWTQNILSAIVSILLSLSKLSSLSDHISTAYVVNYLHSHKTKSFSYSFSFLLVQPFLPMLYQLFWIPFLDSDTNIYFMEVNYVTTHITTTHVIISSLCFIATNAYVDINQQLVINLKSMVNSQSFFSLKQQLDSYIFVSKFVRILSAHFGPTFLNTFISLIWRTIVFLVFAVTNFKKGQYYEIVLHLFTNFYIVFCMFFLCYNCKKVKEEVSLHFIFTKQVPLVKVMSKTDYAYEKVVDANINLK